MSTPAEATAKRDAVLDRWAAGESCQQIAAALGLTRRESASVIVQRARLKGDPRAADRRAKRGMVGFSVPSEGTVARSLQREAAARALGPRELVQQIVAAVATHNLYTAVLDD